MNNLNDWFAALGTLEKIYWFIAIPASLVFVIQLFTAFIGVDGDDVADPDVEVESDGGMGFHFLTLRNLVAFFTIMSWAGIACIDSGFGTTATISISIFAGLLMMTAMATLMYFMYRLRETGNVVLKNAVGKRGEAYLRIPANKSSFGKIQITLQGSVHEFNAINDSDKEIPTGAIIEVVEVLEGNVMRVKLG